MAAALLLLSAAAPALADDAVAPVADTAPKKKAKKSKKDGKPANGDMLEPDSKEPPGAETGNNATTPAKPSVPLAALPPADLPPLLTVVNPNLLDLSQATPANIPTASTDLLPIDLDAICIYPFEQEDAEVDATLRARNQTALDEIHQIFVEIARRSKVSVVVKTSPEKRYGIDDTKDLADLGASQGCGAMLVGHSTRLQNGFVLRARFIDTAQRVQLAKVDQGTNTSSDAEWRAWTQGQACNVFSVKCPAALKLDADRETMSVLVNDQTTLKHTKGKLIETFALRPGVYTLAASLGSNSSRVHLIVPVGLNETKTIYVRQQRDGAVLISDRWLPASIDPPSKVPFILGCVGAGLGVVAEGFAVQQYAHSQSLASGATDNYNANGYYKPADLADVSSARTAQHNSNISAIAGGVLIVAGAVVAWIFRP